MFKQVHGLLPNLCSGHSHIILKYTTQYQTQYQTFRDLHKFPSRTTLFDKSFLLSAPDNWSLLPESIKNSPTLRSFGPGVLIAVINVTYLILIYIPITIFTCKLLLMYIVVQLLDNYCQWRTVDCPPSPWCVPLFLRQSSPLYVIV